MAAVLWRANPRRVIERARLRVAIVLHAVAEIVADAACRVAPKWGRGEAVRGE